MKVITGSQKTGKPLYVTLHFTNNKITSNDNAL